MKEKVEFLEKLKTLLMKRNWTTVSIYKDDNKVLVYMDGGLELEFEPKLEKIGSKKGDK